MLLLWRDFQEVPVHIGRFRGFKYLCSCTVYLDLFTNLSSKAREAVSILRCNQQIFSFFGVESDKGVSSEIFIIFSVNSIVVLLLLGHDILFDLVQFLFILLLCFAFKLRDFWSDLEFAKFLDNCSSLVHKCIDLA